MADPDMPVTVGNARKRRGVCKASITRIETRLTTLEAETCSALVKATQAKLLLAKLNEADSFYETCHLAIIDTVEEDDTLEVEQRTLDTQIDTIQDLSVRLQTLIDTAHVSSTSDECKNTNKCIQRLDRRLSALSTSIDELRSPTTPHVKQFEEQLLDYKSELTEVTNRIFFLDLEDTDDVVVRHTRLEGVVCALSLRLKELSISITSASASLPSDSKCAKLPTLDVPTFHGNPLNWRSFWEQFTISNHKRTNISNSEKLVYLQQLCKVVMQGTRLRVSLELEQTMKLLLRV